MGGGKRDKKAKTPFAKKKRLRQLKANQARRDEREITELVKRVQDEAPPKGQNPLQDDDPNAKKMITKEGVVFTASRKFEELAISWRTKQGLQANAWKHLTDIQRAAIPHALAGRDVLGAAMTGSGKTLAFIVPVLELLFRLSWSKSDGIGAVVISPTRELAMQIFDVLKRAGSKHEFSAGLIIGGKDFEFEKDHIIGMNILICTPGRLLQHLEQTYGLNVENVQIVVLDEADRLLDMGFRKTLDLIMNQLPRERQTLLFSATQTKSVASLARLSMKSPEYLAVHTQKNRDRMPSKLKQHYMIVNAEEKLDVLYSFIKSHLRAKTIVFVSTVKQVQFMWEAFRRLHPGLSVMAIHGRMSQEKRMAVFTLFHQRPAALLFTTDLSARGLDFKKVNWVVHFDCPESKETYVHRAGRTARYNKKGMSLMFLTESEKKMTSHLKNAGVPLKHVKANASALVSITGRFASFLAEDPALKYTAQRALVSYVRSVHLQKDKEVFSVEGINLDALAKSMGLATTPKLKQLRKSATGKKNMSYDLMNLMKKSKQQLRDDGDDGEKGASSSSRTDRLLARKNATVLSSAYERMRDDGDESGGDDNDDGGEGGNDADFHDGLLKVKKKGSAVDSLPSEWTKEEIQRMSRNERRKVKAAAAAAKQQMQEGGGEKGGPKKKEKKEDDDDDDDDDNDDDDDDDSQESEDDDNDDDDEEDVDEKKSSGLTTQKRLPSSLELSTLRKRHLEEVRARVSAGDKEDRQALKERLKKKRMQRKKRGRESTQDMVVTLGGYDDGEEEEEEEEEEDDQDPEGHGKEEEEEEEEEEDDDDDDEEDDEEEQGQRSRKRQKTRNPGGKSNDGALQDDEALALSLLG